MKIKQNLLAVASLIFAVNSPTSNAQVPNVFSSGTPARAAEVNANFSSLDARSAAAEARLDALEAGAPSGAKTEIAVDCDTTPDFFTDASFEGTPNVAYTISGQCDGPIVIRHDDVDINGADGSGASITLPVNIDISAISEGAAVLVDGAARVFISNLTLDASNYNNETDGSGTLFVAHGGYAQTVDVTSTGGQYGMLAYRNGFLRLDGTTTIQNFVNSGLTVGDDSAVIAFGSVDVSTTDESGGYIDGVEAFGDGLIAFRNDLTVSVPAPTPTIGFRNAVFSGSGSLVAATSGAVLDITGNVQVNRNSYLGLSDGTIAGDITARLNGQLELNNIEQSGNGFTSLDSASTANFSGVDLAGDIAVDANSTLDMFEGTIAANLNVNTDARANLNRVNLDGATGDINSDGGNIDIFESKFNFVSVNNDARLNAADSEVSGIFGSSSSALLFSNSSITGNVGLDDGSFLRLSSTSYTAGIDEAMFLFNSKVLFDDATISGEVALEDSSSARIVNSTLNNPFRISTGSYARLISSVQNGVNSNIDVSNGRAHIDESQIGRVDAFLDATIVLAKTTFAGLTANAGSNVQVFGGTADGDIGLFGNSAINMDVDENGAGTLNGNTVFLCGNSPISFIAGFDPAGPDTGYAASGTVDEFGCLP